MIQQIEAFDGKALAIEIIEGFTKEDEALIEKFIQEKIAGGNRSVNLLLKLDEAKISKSEIKAFVNETKFLVKHLDSIDRIAVVGNSVILDELVTIDSLFYKLIKQTGEEKYYDVGQLDEAMDFINEK